jgi:hypothetical protein
MNCFSQTPNPDLFQTWYLYDYYSSDDNVHHPVSTITPAVSPYVTFSGTSDFSGMGACNAFYGTFSSPADNLILFNTFAGTLLLCNATQHITLEGAFFSLFQSGGEYYISGTGTAMSLVIFTPIFNTYVFGNAPLATERFTLNQTVVYPNPADSEIFIDAKNNVIDQVDIVNSLGQTVKTVSTNFDSIPISDLASGVYILKLFSDGKTAYRKIIKK